MTHLQQQTINEMMRQGLHSQLYNAAQLWQENKKYKLQNNEHIPIYLHDLIKKSNHQIDSLVADTNP
ncbi:MAG: hypothetical protein QM479_02950 [Pseudomonadota bacterium]